MPSIKTVAQRLAPTLYETWRHRIGYPAKYRRAANVISMHVGQNVIGGPFCGMKLAHAVTGSYVPKLLGCYEAELHGVVDDIVRHSPRKVIDVGCGEGYYLVGLSLLLPEAQFVGFDIDAAARTACTEQAALNGVSTRVRVEARCDIDSLALELTDQSLLICDCEGYELDLLDPQRCPPLGQGLVLVELHEQLAPGVTHAILKRFQPTHKITLFDSVPRDPADYVEVKGLSHKNAEMVLNEKRFPNMQWAWMVPLRADR